MKKTFTTILTFFYLLSGLGYSSVLYYCPKKQKTLSPCEIQCCSTKASSESSKEYQHTEKPVANTGSVMMAIVVVESIPGKCCEIRHKYNQLDNSFLPLNIDIGQIDTFGGKLYNYPQHSQNIDKSVYSTFVNPFTYVNLPLLI